jgi:hypothetical protein
LTSDLGWEFGFGIEGKIQRGLDDGQDAQLPAKDGPFVPQGKLKFLRVLKKVPQLFFRRTGLCVGSGAGFRMLRSPVFRREGYAPESGPRV